MSVSAAALTLAWIAIVLLAFGMAGTLTLVRQQQAQLSRLARSGADSPPGVFSERVDVATAAARLAPESRAFGLVMLTSPNCAACKEVLPRFERLAQTYA